MNTEPERWTTAPLIGKTIKDAVLFENDPVRIVLMFTDGSQALFEIGSNRFAYSGAAAPKE